MRRGSTYDVTVKVGMDVTSADVLHVAFRSTKRTVLVKEYSPEGPSEVEMEESDGVTTISTVLSQTDTLKFKEGQPVEGQIRCRIGDSVYATPIFTVAQTVDPIIEDAVI